MATEYKKEFFDRDYTTFEAYCRVWKYARKYHIRLAIGIIASMLTAGTLVPLFQVIQPTLQNISASDVKKTIGNQNTGTSDALAGKEAQVDTCAPASSKKESKLEREMRQASSLPSWYPKAEQVARKFGFKLQSEDGSMEAPFY